MTDRPLLIGVLVAFVCAPCADGASPPTPVSFATNSQALGAGFTWYVEIADLDGDGSPDAYFEGRVWRNDGKGHFTRTDQSFGAAERPAYFADLDGDRDIDAVCDGVVYLNDGRFHFADKRPIETSVSMHAASLRDVDGDGDIDIIVASPSEDRLLLNDGRASFRDTGRTLGGWAQCTYAVGDVNGDGLTDVYVAIPHTPPPDMALTKDRLWLGDGHGGLRESTHDIPMGEHRGVVLADLNADGSVDVAVSGPGGSLVFLNDDAGKLVDSGQRFDGGTLLAADFNGDGALDLFLGRGSPVDDGKPNLVWMNDGRGSFTDSGLRLGNANSIEGATADINGDGAPDVFVANVKNVATGKGEGLNEVWLNTTNAVRNPSMTAGRSPLDGAPVTLHESFDCDYLGETPPGDEPMLFAPGRVSVDGKNTHALVFSPDGTSLIFSRYPDRTSFRMTRIPGGWTSPQETGFRGKEVSFDPEHERLFYYDQGDLFFVRTSGGGFSGPTRLPGTINSREAEYYPVVTAKRNLYFSRVGQWEAARVQVARIDGEGFAAPVDLGEPINVGGASHAFVSPEESYMIFNSPRTGSRTKNDLWVSFRGADGAWGTPVNLGPEINHDAMAVLCPSVSPDGKYLFFTRLQEGGTGFVYWVSTRVVERARTRAQAGPPLHVTYVANEGFLLSSGGQSVLIDALFDTGFDRFKVPSADVVQAMIKGTAPFADIDALLLTHNDGDHLSGPLVAEFLKRHEETRFVSADASSMLAAAGVDGARLRPVEVDVGGVAVQTIGGVAITALRIKHYQDRDGLRQANLAFLVTIGGRRILHPGDGAIGENVALLEQAGPALERGGIDLLFTQYFDASEETARYVNEVLKPKQVVIMHVPVAPDAERLAKLRDLYPGAVVFTESLETRAF